MVAMTPIPDRAAARLAWTRHVLDDASLTLESASADASFRSYWRTRHAGRSWVVMDSPPAQEDPRPWLEIGARLSAAGLHVPAVQAQDLEQGFLLIEDLGSQLYLPALNDNTADALYGDAMDALLRMQRDVDTAGMQPYDHAFLQRELEIMPEWFLRRHLGYTPECEAWDVLESAFTMLLKSALEQPRCFVHRDYHSRNLLIVASDNPGIIDFQGALFGPITYDLASLLRDAFLSWDEEHELDWAVRYWQDARHAGLPVDPDFGEFWRQTEWMGLQRHLKILGIFCRLKHRDGKPHYSADLPRFFNYATKVANRYGPLRSLLNLLEPLTGAAVQAGYTF